MAKIKVYDPKKERAKEQAKDKLQIVLEIFVDLILYALVLMLASSIFKGFYVESFAYAFLAAAILSGLNATIKPLLIYLTLPITILTLGIFYPIINIIILKLCALCLGSHFIVEGFIAPFFLVIFISLIKMLLDALILNKIRK